MYQSTSIFRKKQKIKSIVIVHPFMIQKNILYVILFPYGIELET